MWCHTEIEVADQTFHLTLLQYTDTGQTGPSIDIITPGAWQGSHWSPIIKSLVWLDPGKSCCKRDSNLGSVPLKVDALTTRPTRQSGHQSTYRLKEKEVEKRSGKNTTLWGWEWSMFNLANIGTVLRTTLRRNLVDGTDPVWAFLSVMMPSLAETETDSVSCLCQDYSARCQLFVSNYFLVGFLGNRPQVFQRAVCE